MYVWIFLAREINRVCMRTRVMDSIEFITTLYGRAGLCVEGMTDECGTNLHGTSRAIRFQFPGRCFFTGRIGGSLQGTWNDVHGVAGPRRSLRRAAFL